jgi:hypothetical protein
LTNVAVRNVWKVSVFTVGKSVFWVLWGVVLYGFVGGYHLQGQSRPRNWWWHISAKGGWTVSEISLRLRYYHIDVERYIIVKELSDTFFFQHAVETKPQWRSHWKHRTFLP